jgi:hypothetical protein
LFTGLHAHYTASSWDETAGMWQDVSGNARHSVKTHFNGNSDRNTKVIVAFTDPVTARYVRIRPRTWTNWISMRAGLLIGQATEVVPYERLEYSSTAFNHPKGIGCGQGMLDSPWAWCAASNDLNQWIQMDTGQVKVINGVVTQGRQDYDQWVTSYFIETSSDGNTWFSATLTKILPVTISPGNSTTGRIASVVGTSSQVEFPSDTIPSVFTICSISRYSYACFSHSRTTFLTLFMNKFFHHFTRISSGVWLFSNCF